MSGHKAVVPKNGYNSENSDKVRYPPMGENHILEVLYHGTVMSNQTMLLGFMRETGRCLRSVKARGDQESQLEGFKNL